MWPYNRGRCLSSVFEISWQQGRQNFFLQRISVRDLPPSLHMIGLNTSKSKLVNCHAIIVDLPLSLSQQKIVLHVLPTFSMFSHLRDGRMEQLIEPWLAPNSRYKKPHSRYKKKHILDSWQKFRQTLLPSPGFVFPYESPLCCYMNVQN